MSKTYILEGKKFYDLESFLKEFARVVNAPNGYFGKDLEQFDDCLFSDYYGLQAPCKIIWKDSDFSKEKLDCNMLIEYHEKVKKLYEKALVEEIKEFHNAGEKNVDESELFSYFMLNNTNCVLKKAREEGFTLFDEIVYIINSISRRTNDKSWSIELILN